MPGCPDSCICVFAKEDGGPGDTLREAQHGCASAPALPPRTLSPRGGAAQGPPGWRDCSRERLPRLFVPDSVTFLCYDPLTTVIQEYYLRLV